MRNPFPSKLDPYRLRKGRFATPPGATFGAFLIPCKALGERTFGAYTILADDGAETGWEHVSVSMQRAADSLPGWLEMDAIKRLFWLPTETVVQYHVPDDDHISNAEVLHLWRPTDGAVPRPPNELVGVAGLMLPSGQ